ncbi:hypothetical protein JTB14_005027 [Gonioctena quinquepunctata]|nr:hypothetical protein JTB14_005027 [Gonioctena quinquepunctata]
MNRHIVTDVLDELDSKGKLRSIYNMDEECRLTIHHQQTGLALKGSERVHLVAPEHTENVNIFGCASAIGSAMPPMVIFKRKRLNPEYLDYVLPGTLIKISPKNSMVTELFIEFSSHLAKHKVNGKIL